MPRGAGSFASLTSLSVLALFGTLHAQDFEGKKISELEIVYNGAKTVDEARLRNLMASKGGTSYRSENIDNDIKSLYGSGLVDDVIFSVEPQGGSLKLIAKITTRPALGGVGFVGNSIFSEQKLAKESKMKPGGALSDEQILEARRNIEKYYQGYGYPDVTVTHRTQATGQAGLSDLVFVIDEGSKNEIRNIRFEGLQNFSDPELRKEMKVKEKGWFAWFTKSGQFESNSLDQDMDAILDYCRTKGYLRATGTLRRDPVGDGRTDLVIQISEGDKYTVASVGLGKMTVFKSEELYPSLTLVSKSAYSSKKMRDDMTMIRNFYGSRGYADAQVTQDISSAGPNQVNILYRVSEGKRFRVGRVNISGNTKTQDKVIRREIPLEPGDQFNSVELETTKKRLENLQYFSEVRATGTPGGSGYRDVDVLVEEKETGTVSVGAAFSSIESIYGFLTLEQANFNFWNPWNFTGAGQRFSMKLKAGGRTSEFSVSLVEPWFLDQKLALGTELFYKQSTFFSDSYQQSNFGAAVSLRKPLGAKSSIKGELRVEEINVDSDINAKDFKGKGNNSELSEKNIGGDFLRSAASVNYIYDNRDSNLLARNGENLDVRATLAGGVIGGDVDTFSVAARGGKYWGLKWDTILSVTGELATVNSIGGGEIPIFERVFLGGGQTLRGFKFRDVGPRDSNYTEEVYGGNSLGYASVEYTVPVIETVRAAVFSDVGFVNEGSWDFGLNKIYGDVGVGIRLKLPISPLPLSLDYAFPVVSPDERADNGGQFNFSLSSQF